MHNSISIFENKPLNLAHRGYTVSAPENTVAAFQAALDLGVDGIEFDVRTCKSGEVVVFHDPMLSRMTHGRGFVKNKTLAELKRLRIRSQNRDIDHQIPTFEEVIELVKGQAILNVEIKTKGVPKDHIEEKVVAILRQYGIEYNSILSSFNPIVVRRIKKIDDQIITGFLMDKSFTVRYSEIPLTKLAGAKSIHLENDLAKDSFIRKIQALGFYCVVWNVNNPEEMQRLIELEVNGIITDRPEQMKEIKFSVLHA